MKVRTEREALATSLAWVARAINRAPMAPALAGIRVTASEGGLAIRAFDYEVSHAATLEADVAGEGECLVPGYFLRDAVAGGRGSEVELALEAGTLTITSGRSTYRLRALALEDYPSLPEFPTTVGTVDAEALADATARALPPADDGSPHDNLRGLRVEGSDSGLAIVSTDGSRLHTHETSWDRDADFAATVPARTFEAAVRGLGGTVTLGYADGLLGLSDGARRVTTRCYSVAYADWCKALSFADKSISDRLTVDGDDLRAAVKTVGSVTDTERPIVLRFADGELAVETGAQESGEGCEVLEAEGDGPEFELGLNPRYLLDLLGACPDGPVELHYAGAPSEGKAQPLLVVAPDHPALRLLVMSKRSPGGTR